MTNAPAGQVNTTNAPRDASKLQTLGPFMLKRLMEEGCKNLGISFGDAERQAFLRDPLDKRANDVLGVLQQIDATGGGAPPQLPAAAAPAPAATPAAAAPTEDKPPKTPVTRGKANGVANGTNGTAAHAPADGVEILQGLVGAIKEISSGITAMHKTVKELDTGAKRFDSLESQMTEMFKLQHLTFALVAQIAENTLGAPAKDILETAANEYVNLEPVVTKLISGK